jgi:ketosteroid isomerase-like protein
MILIAAASLILAACAPSVPLTDSKDPVAVVKNFYEVLNTKDVEKAMSLTAEDYVMNDPFGTYDRSGALIQWQAVVDAGLTFNQTNFVDTGNGRVTSCYEVFENGKSIDKGCGNVTHVRDGKIIFDGLLPAEQIWIAQKHYEAINTGNLEAAMSLVAEDVKCRGTCYLNGKESYQFLVQGFIQTGGRTELSDFVVDGDKVTYNWIGYNQNNAVAGGGTEFMQIKDGKIILIESDLR